MKSTSQGKGFFALGIIIMIISIAFSFYIFLPVISIGFLLMVLGLRIMGR